MTVFTRNELDDGELERLLDKAWGEGWRVGFYTDPDTVVKCPYEDPVLAKKWTVGLDNGSDAREMFEKDHGPLHPKALELGARPWPNGHPFHGLHEIQAPVLAAAGE